ILHHVCSGRLSERPVHGRRQGRRGHGKCRQDQAWRRSVEWRRRRTGPDDQGHRRRITPSRRRTIMAEIKDPENTIVMETTKGRVVIQLLPDLAPGHVARIKELTREGAYDGVVFHRVIEDFMAQTGDVQYGKTGGKDFNPGRAGMGGSEKPDLKAEFSNRSEEHTSELQSRENLVC